MHVKRKKFREKKRMRAKYENILKKINIIPIDIEKILYRDNQFLFIKDNKEVDIPSNRKILEDFVKDYAIEDKVRAQHVVKPSPLVNRKGSITTISIPPQKSDDTLTTDEDIDYHADLNDNDL